MEHHLCVILYSKYSQLSVNLMKALETAPVNLANTVGLTPVCIDNEEVRARILKANQIDISSVPCILIVYPAGGVEKYEGNDAVKWVEQTVYKYMPPPPPPPQPRPQPPPRPPRPSRIQEEERSPSPPPQRPPRKKPSKKQQLPVESSESEEEYVTPKRPPPKKPPPRPKAPLTNIEDLDDEEEDIVRPPVAVRSGPGGYDVTDDFGQPNDSNREARTRPTTQIATGGGTDLMSAAMAMQKERENVDSKSNNQRPI